MHKEELKEKITKARNILASCEICPRNCRVNRVKGELGFCKTGDEIRISSWGPHFGEEAPLVGSYGSGTIFLTSCNLGCVFCQNYDISRHGGGKSISADECAELMIKLQKSGCHNINFVTPTHVAPQLMEAILIAKEEGLQIPIVYNCGGYESLKMLKLLNGFIDIYMPDAKYSNKQIADEMSRTPDYFEKLKEALIKMHSQVGDLKLDSNGIAIRGLLVRHLVMPNGYSGTQEIVNFIAQKISKETYINIMDQYHPCYEAIGHPNIGRMITREEFNDAVEIAKKTGLHNFL